MGSRYREISLQGAKTLPQEERKNKVSTTEFAAPVSPSKPLSTFLKSLPKTLSAKDLLEFAGHICDARKGNKGVFLMLGGHVVKTGCSTILIDLVEKGLVSHVAMNGAAAIHDFEIAVWGETSEDVSDGLEKGTFGMADGAPGLMNPASEKAMREKKGLGETFGEVLLSEKASHADMSILASAYRAGIPCTVHVAIGTDILHQHPGADGAAIGDSSMRDFRIFCAGLPAIDSGGAVLNLGSCVLMPEVFLKALTIARNLGNRVKDFFTADFDMIKHYRPMVNVVQRPVEGGGKGYAFTGSHELMIPLFHGAIMDRLQRDSR